MVTRRSRLPSPVRLLGVLLAAALAVTVAPATPSSAAPTAGRVAAPSGTDVGRWDVAPLGEGRYRVSWTSPTDLQLNSDRPTIGGAGLRFGPSTVAGDARTVEAVVTAVRPPDPADLDVVLSGDRLDESGDDPSTRSGGTQPLAPPTTPLPAADPGVPGPFTTVSSDYTLPGVKLPEMPRKIEMVGHVVEPAPDQATGPRPLVVFLHGRHGVCYDPTDDDAYTEEWPCSGAFEEIPSHLGYVYIAAAAGLAGLRDGLDPGQRHQRPGLPARRRRRRRPGRDRRADTSTTGSAWPPSTRSTSTRSCSSATAAAARASTGRPSRSRSPRRTGSPARCSSPPPTSPPTPRRTCRPSPCCPTATATSPTSRARGSPTPAATWSPATPRSKSSVLVMGANHNFFNTEWTPGTAAAPSFDDWGGEARRAVRPEAPGAAQGRPAAGRGQGLHRRCRAALRR